MSCSRSPLPQMGNPSQGTHWEAGTLCLPALSLLRVLCHSASLVLADTGLKSYTPSYIMLSPPWKRCLFFSALVSCPPQNKIKMLHFSKCLLKVNVWSSRTKTKAWAVICFLHWLPPLCTVLSQGKKIGSSHLQGLAEGPGLVQP